MRTDFRSQIFLNIGITSSLKKNVLYSKRLILSRILSLAIISSMTIESKVTQKLIDTKKTLTLAESCTGGLIASRLTNCPGSSKYLLCGIVSYSNMAKTRTLKIPENIIKKHGAVSSQVATLMAKNVRKLYISDFAIGISGIAGPDGGTRTKPVGLTYIAVASQNEAICLKCEFTGERRQIKTKASTQALRLLYDFIY